MTGETATKPTAGEPKALQYQPPVAAGRTRSRVETTLSIEGASLTASYDVEFRARHNITDTDGLN